MTDYSVALSWAREVLRHPDENLTVKKRKDGVTVIRFTSGTAYMEVGLQRRPLALLADAERARIDRLAGGAA